MLALADFKIVIFPKMEIIDKDYDAACEALEECDFEIQLRDLVRSLLKQPEFSKFAATLDGVKV